MRIRAADHVRYAYIASGGQGASPLEPVRQGAGADGGFAALTFADFIWGLL